MTPQLRPYQQQLSDAIDHAWQAGERNVLAVAPTGSGKTVLFSDKLTRHRGAAMAIAHRPELVGQISTSLARFGLRHRLIGPRKVIKLILDQPRAQVGRQGYDPNAQTAATCVDTPPLPPPRPGAQ